MVRYIFLRAPLPCLSLSEQRRLIVADEWKAPDRSRESSFNAAGQTHVRHIHRRVDEPGALVALTRLPVNADEVVPRLAGIDDRERFAEIDLIAATTSPSGSAKPASG